MRKSQGMTFIGTLFTIIVIVILATIVIRVIPVYLQYFSIRESIKGLNTISSSSLTGDSFADVDLLKSNLNKLLEINGAQSLKEDELIIVPNGENKFNIKLKYQVTKPLLYNVSLLFNFNYTEEVVLGSEN
ncbi:MAG: DUF4845 domain-containing protein [Legionella longbeachae]|nr:DUF4845 domain-containing protein [Legionella longbeachae]